MQHVLGTGRLKACQGHTVIFYRDGQGRACQHGSRRHSRSRAYPDELKKAAQLAEGGGNDSLTSIQVLEVGGSLSVVLSSPKRCEGCGPPSHQLKQHDAILGVGDRLGRRRSIKLAKVEIKPTTFHIAPLHDYQSRHSQAERYRSPQFNQNLICLFEGFEDLSHLLAGSMKM